MSQTAVFSSSRGFTAAAEPSLKLPTLDSLRGWREPHPERNVFGTRAVQSHIQRVKFTNYSHYVKSRLKGWHIFHDVPISCHRNFNYLHFLLFCLSNWCHFLFILISIKGIFCHNNSCCLPESKFFCVFFYHSGSQKSKEKNTNRCNTPGSERPCFFWPRSKCINSQKKKRQNITQGKIRSTRV